MNNFTILLVEDNPADARLTELALKDCKLVHELHVASDGEEALAFLNQEPPYGNSPAVDLILLDLNLPGMSGLEVLNAIRDSEILKNIPVIILTVSESEQDILDSYDLYVNGYITKPLGTKVFVEVIKQIERFWFSVVKLPPRTDH